MSDTTDSHAECGQDLHPLSNEQCSHPKGHAGPHSDATPDRVQKGDRLRIWKGARPGRNLAAVALSGVLDWHGTPSVRVELVTGGTDYIALTHVQVTSARPRRGGLLR